MRVIHRRSTSISNVIVLLDTTVLIDVLRGRVERKTLLAELIKQGHTLATSAMNIGEVYSGMRSGEEQQTNTFLTSLICYDITAAIAQRAGVLKSRLSTSGRTRTLADMLVAATALEHTLRLLTDNTRDFAIPDLVLLSLPPSTLASTP